MRTMVAPKRPLGSASRASEVGLGHSPSWLIAGGTTLALLAAIVIGAKLAARSLGIEDPAFRHENELAMWRDEPRIGYANAKHFSGFSYGNIPVETNERGFRGTRPTPGTRRWTAS